MKKSLLKRIFDKLPVSLQKIIKKIYHLDKYIPFCKAYKKKKWIRNKYWAFGQNERKFIFLSIARFCHINRPINGYYFEFGCHMANTIRMAWDNFKYLFDWDYVAFDSFEGLPEILEIDKQKIWEKGKLKTEVDEFEKIVLKHGIPKEKLRLVKGFYDESLNDELTNQLLPGKAAVVYIDCDLYVSTVPILTFIKPFLQKGTIIVFDDWFCFHGDPAKGERRAFQEFRDANPSLVFEDFVQTNEAKTFIFLGDKDKNFT